MPARDGPRRLRAAADLLAVAQLGHAHWFFGNLYEAVVKVPELQARQRSHRGDEPALSPFGRGSPVRYYALTAPAWIPAVLAAVPVGWTARESRAWLGASAVCSAVGGAATVYLVRSVNLKLLFSSQRHTHAERTRLLRTWYRVNAVRILAAGGAWFAAHQARERLSR